MQSEDGEKNTTHKEAFLSFFPADRLVFLTNTVLLLSFFTTLSLCKDTAPPRLHLAWRPRTPRCTLRATLMFVDSSLGNGSPKSKGVWRRTELYLCLFLTVVFVTPLLAQGDGDTVAARGA